MNVDVIGGGPGGAYAALLLQKEYPEWDVSVYERYSEATTYGWGIVLPEKIYPTLEEADEPTYEQIVALNTKWDPIDTFHRGERVRCGGYPYTSVLRTDLLEVLQGRCQELGVDMHFETPIEDVDERAEEADLVVAADGVHSRTRKRYADAFGTTLDDGENRFSWFGTDQQFDALSHVYVENEDGLWHAGAYPGTTSTFIVSCEPNTWETAGFDEASEEEYISYLEDVFEEYLDGYGLLSKEDRWRQFTTVRNESWFHENVVLLGDAAHTAHFTIGSGTRMAMEDAIGLRDALKAHDDLYAALEAYESERKPHVEALQNAAERSVEHFENIERLSNLDPIPFAMLYLTRTGHNTYEGVREKDPSFVEAVDRWFAARARGVSESRIKDPSPPLRQPFTCRGVTLPARPVSAPTLSEPASDGDLSEDQAARLLESCGDDVGLLLAPSLAADRSARPSDGSLGLYSERHREQWSSAIEQLAERYDARVGTHLLYAGQSSRPDDAVSVPSGGTEVARRSEPLSEPFDEETVESVRSAYVDAARRADAAGFDLLGVDLSRGSVLGQLLAGTSTDRADGTSENQLRIPTSVVGAVRDAWPDDRPLSVALPPIGAALDAQETYRFGSRLSSAGCDLITVLSPPDRDAGVKRDVLRSSKLIRSADETPTLAAVGATSDDEGNTLLASGRADLYTVGDPS